MQITPQESCLGLFLHLVLANEELFYLLSQLFSMLEQNYVFSFLFLFRAESFYIIAIMSHVIFYLFIFACIRRPIYDGAYPLFKRDVGSDMSKTFVMLLQ